MSKKAEKVEKVESVEAVHPVGIHFHGNPFTAKVFTVTAFSTVTFYNSAAFLNT